LRAVTSTKNEGEVMKKGLIIKAISGEYTVFLPNQQTIVCKPRGLFRYRRKNPLVGDIVAINEEERVITSIYPRKNSLERPLIANVDKVFLVFSVIEPDLNLNLLDRLISIMEYQDIKIIIVFTKLDLLANKENFNSIHDYYEQLGYRIYRNDIPDFIEQIKQEVNEHLCVVAGQSGVGKSTLLNIIDPELNLKTDVVSTTLNRGKHTTRHIELIRILEGWLADTPGFGIANFEEIDLLTLSHTFREFYQASSKCKFSKCTHIDEPDCEVKRLVEKNMILSSRYQNYLLFANEIKETKKNKY
jgi:ribosome biogenesis GTPase